MPLPFRRIAILPENLPAENTELWMDHAARNGADAWYIRIKDAGDLRLPMVAEIFRSPAHQNSFVILPEVLSTQTEIPFHALQFSENNFSRLRPHPNYMCCVSCHSAESVRRSMQLGADFVFLSPVFATRTHPDAKALGIDFLERVCVSVSVPVVALGGIDTEEKISLCMNAGASAVAGIRMFEV